MRSPDDLGVDIPTEEPVGPVLSFDGGAQESAPGLLRSSMMLTVVAMIANGFNVVFHFATARLMGAEEYSLLTSMFAVFLVATVPLLAIQATIAREMAILIGRGDERAAGLVLCAALRTVTRVAAGAIVVAVALFYPLVAVINIERPLPVVAVIVAFLVQLPGPLMAGALQASERFWVLSWTQALQSGLKLTAGVGLAAAGLGASAVTFGFALATIVAFAAAVWTLRPYFHGMRGEQLPATRIIGRYTLGAAVALGFHAVLVNSGLIWGRGTLRPDIAGLYSAATVTTSILLLIPIGLTSVLFSRVSKLAGEGGERSHLNTGLLITAVLAVPCVVVLAVMPTTLLHVAFGSQYDGASPWLWPLGIATGLYALGIVYINHLLALGRSGVAWVMTAVVLVQQVLYTIFRGTPDDLIGVQIVSAAMLVLGCEAYMRREASRARTRVPPG